MPEHRVKLIVNPSADLGRAWMAARDLLPIVEEFGGADWAGTVYPTHAIELARQAGEQGYELVIAAGGDGTAHEVLNGLMQVPRTVAQALGSYRWGRATTSLTHWHGANPLKALGRSSGKPRWIDVVRLEDNLKPEYFGNTVGVGFDAVTIRSRNFRQFHGVLIYLVAVVQTILLNHDAPRMQVETDRERWEQEMLLLVLCNGGREGGGFRINPQAKLDDGMLNYAGIQRVSRPMMFRLLPEVMRGTHGRFRQVKMGEFLQMNVTSDSPMYIHIDGEIFAGWGVDIRRLGINILPQELQVVS
jgi:diacylglycerol kinase family enzyme